MSDRHPCPGAGCPKTLPFSVLACTSHWRSLPPEVRGRLSRAWRQGDMTEYLAIREEAVQLLSATSAPVPLGDLTPEQRRLVLTLIDAAGAEAQE